MSKTINTLLIGESWMIQTTETKGFDTFTVSSYGEGTEFIRPVLSGEGFTFTHMPCHRISEDFPRRAEDLAQFDVIIISDVGANTFLLPIETFLQCKTSPNKLEMLKNYVLQGGGLCMAGGYLSFMGIEGKGKYRDSLLEEILPVRFQPGDDRMEHPEGLDVAIDPGSHPILHGLPPAIHGILGYNKAEAKPEGRVIARIQGDPFLTLGEFGKGRSIAFATDVAPHWASQDFCQSEAYRTLWQNMARWLAKAI